LFQIVKKTPLIVSALIVQFIISVWKRITNYYSVPGVKLVAPLKNGVVNVISVRLPGITIWWDYFIVRRVQKNNIFKENLTYGSSMIRIK
jgi:hypothetical protein